MAISTAGELDADFADRGRLLLGRDCHEAQLRKVYALESNCSLCIGSIQLKSEKTHRFAAARTTPAGELDRSFADDGYLLGEPAQVSVHRFSGLASSDQGELMLVGNVADKSRDELLRCTAHGQCLNRWQLTAPGAKSNTTHPMITTGHGGCLWLCSSTMHNGKCGGALYRRLPGGERDDAFADNGTLDFCLDNTYVRFNDLAITDEQGHLVVAADIHPWTSSDSSLTLCCFDRDSGEVVSAFGANGRFTYPPSHSLYRLLSIQRVIATRHGLLVIIQSYDGQGAIYSCFIRVTEQGELDGSFNAGKPIVIAGAYSDVAVQSDDRIIVLASNLYPDTVVRRYLVNGEKDCSFGNRGEVLLGQPGERFYALAVQADDKILVSGVGRSSVLYRLQG